VRAASTRATVLALAFDSQMAGVGSIDEDLPAATHFDSWLDMRCQPYIERIDRDYGDLVTRLTGCPPTCDHGPKIYVVERGTAGGVRPYRQIPHALGLRRRDAWPGLRAGEAYIDYTFLHFTALSDAQHGAWSDELCRAFGC
jgi:xylulokinase